MNLLLALRQTTTGMTATELVARVEGYDQQAPQAARRMFERDKNELRSLGVPVLVVGPDTEPRYLVDESGYALPPLRLDAEQAAAIELAASAWRDGDLPVAARRALTKLRAVAEGRDEDGPALTGAGTLADLTLDLAGSEVPAALAAAVEERRVVSFDYASASSGTLARRTVEPYRLRVSEGAWYLEGRDTQVGQARTFRLARVRGQVEVVSAPGAFEPEAEPPARRPSAVLGLVPGRALALRARSRRQQRQLAGYDVVAVDYEDLFAFAGSLAALADAVVVLEPAELRELVIEHLRGAVGADEEED
nr:WYL domain-containing protein [Actinomyces sp.]